MGHGVRAALVAAIVRSVVSEFRPLWTGPGDFLFAINRALVEAFKDSDISLCFRILRGGRSFRGPIALCQRRASAAPLRHAHRMIPQNASPLIGARSGPALGLFLEPNTGPAVAISRHATSYCFLLMACLKSRDPEASSTIIKSYRERSATEPYSRWRSFAEPHRRSSAVLGHPEFQR